MSYKFLSSLLFAASIALFTAGCAQQAAEVPKTQATSMYTPASLVDAVNAGDTNLVSKHLKDKLDPNTKDGSGNTLLHLSVTAKNDKMIELLLDNSADINSVDETGFTPLHLAVSQNSQSTVELLLQRGASTEVINSDGFAAIHTATQKNLTVTIKMILKSNMGDIKLKTKEGLTPLLIAISSGHFKLIKYYLKNKADLKVKTNSGLTALQLAMRSNSLQTLDFLLKKGAKLDQVTAEGKTLLHLAAQSGSMKLVKFLVKKGLKVTIKDKAKLFALDYAVENGHVPVVAYIVKKHKKLSSAYKFKLLKTAVKTKNLKTLKILHRAGIDLATIEAKTLSSILHFAVSLDGMEDVINLILKETDLIIHQDAKKLSALDYATKTNRESYIQIMKPFYLKVLIRKYIAKDDFLGLKKLKKKYPEIIDLITDKKYKLALSGPDDLMIGDLRLLTKKGRSVSILVAQINRLDVGYRNFSSNEIGVLVSYGLPAPVIAAIINKTASLAKDNKRIKEAKALKVIQEALLKVQELALQAHSKVAKFQEINADLTKQILEKQDQMIQEQIATRQVIQSNKTSGQGNDLANQVGQKVGKKLIDNLLK